MPKPRKSSDPVRGDPTIPPAKGIELIERQIKAGKALLNQPIDFGTYASWEHTTKSYLEKAFGENHPNAAQFVEFSRIVSFPMNATEEWWAEKRAETLPEQLTLLGGFIGLLRTEIELAEPGPMTNAVADHSKSRKVFVVHGHQHGAKEEVARFVERLGFEAVILHEQPNLGRTLFEKFRDHTEVAYAVILLTGDDRGGPNIDGATLQLRARQNVVFELGYFLALLGPKRVCALLEPGVEKPSDIDGLLYIDLKAAGWRLELAREMRAAGLSVDLNKAL